jgi:hypothetical protein
MIGHNPLHGSGRAAFPHPALALGNDAHATQGIGMTDDRPVRTRTADLYRVHRRCRRTFLLPN